MLVFVLQVPPRHQDPPPGLEAEFALYMFSRRGAFLPKEGVNAQVRGQDRRQVLFVLDFANH